MPLKKILPYTTVILVIAALYVAYTFYERHEADVAAQAQLEAKKAAADKRTLEAVFGDGEIKFSTSRLIQPPFIRAKRRISVMAWRTRLR